MEVDTILSKMFSVKMPQRKFMVALFAVLMYLPTSPDLRNLSRYMQLHEKIRSRWFAKQFDFVEFKLLGINIKMLDAVLIKAIQLT